MKACEACGAFVAEVVAPVGDGAVDACWMCAHLIAVHEVPLARVLDSYEERLCHCEKHEVFPPDVIARRNALLEQSNAGARAEPLPATSGTIYSEGRRAPERPYGMSKRSHDRSVAISRGMRAARALRLESHRAGKNPVRD